MMPPPIRVLALMEASVVGGPAKNLIQTGKLGAQAGSGLPGLELSIVTFQRGSSNAFADSAREAGLDVHVLQERGRFDTAPLEQLKSVVEQVRPDIVQSHNIKSHLFVRLLGLHKRYPWIVFQHGYTATDLKDRIYNQVDRWTLPQAHRVVAVCQAFAKRLEMRGIASERIRVQHNSVRPFVPSSAEEVAKLREQWHVGDEDIILAVGRLSFEKGQADLVRAVAELSRRRMERPWRLMLVGEGPESAGLRTLAASLGVADRVVFAGQQSEMRPYYSMAHVLALPSHSEGSPNVVLEAMAAGLPIVATSVGGVAEILTHEQTGLLVPARDSASMMEGLARLLEDPGFSRTLATRAGQHAAEAYSPEAKYRSLLAIYDDLLREMKEGNAHLPRLSG